MRPAPTANVTTIPQIRKNASRRPELPRTDAELRLGAGRHAKGLVPDVETKLGDSRRCGERRDISQCANR